MKNAAQLFFSAHKGVPATQYLPKAATPGRKVSSGAVSSSAANTALAKDGDWRLYLGTPKSFDSPTTGNGCTALITVLPVDGCGFVLYRVTEATHTVLHWKGQVPLPLHPTLQHA